MMTRRAIIIIGLVVIGFFSVKLPAHAQGLIPDCEKTIYTVKNTGTANTIVCPNSSSTVLNCVTAEKYDEGVNGKVEGIQTNKVCGFEDFIQIFVTLANWGLGIMVALALFFYVYGGFTLLISGGRTEYVENGKKMLVGTTMGVIVMLTAWAMVGFYVIATTGSTQGFLFPKVSQFKAPWFGKADSCRERYANEYNQTDCGRDNLHENCADPVSADGPVTQLQTLLNDRKCDAGTPDGCFGPTTKAALIKFQQLNNLTGNGIVDAGAWSSLGGSGAVSCDAVLGCCITENLAWPQTTYTCSSDVPKPLCTGGKRFQEGNCPDYCS